MLNHQQFANKVNGEGGASRSFATDQAPTPPGVMVSLPNNEKVTKAPVDAAQVKRYKKDNESEGMSSSANYQGAWKSKGKVYHDVSRKHTGLDSARASGEKNNQISGYDLGGTDERRPAGGDVYFGRNVPGVESDPEFKGSNSKTSEAERMSPKPRAQEFAEQAHISRSATLNGKKVSINQVYDKIATNRRGRKV